jgi:SDR family mycofactocin-dependent oxidoreductase
MGKLDGKVAFISGAARGQGRSHAIRLAQEGADIIAVDVCAEISSNLAYQMATPEDLAQTVKQVEALDRRIVARQADVRDPDALRQAFEAGRAQLGTVGIVLANAGIAAGGQSESAWDEVIGVNLTGVWNTVRVALPSMVESEQGGAVVVTSSVAGLLGVASNDPGFLAYTAAKHAVIGLVRSWANFGAPHSIRVNAVCPTTVRTPMAGNVTIEELAKWNPSLANACTSDLPGGNMIEPLDVSNAIAWLVSEDARYVTGTVVPVDAGTYNRR